VLEIAALSMATFFATIGPLDVAAIFAALTAGSTRQHRRSMAIRGTLIATFILVLFALVGEAVLGSLGISLPALRTAGGILLLLCLSPLKWSSRAQQAAPLQRMKRKQKLK
jgi:multiple antibiotic resistance protein